MRARVANGVQTMKFNVLHANFPHHRDGWAAATRQLEKIHDPNGPLFLDWADRIFRDGQTITRPWYGILHNVVNYPSTEYNNKYSGKIFDLSTLVKKDFFLESLKYCKRLFTLCRHTSDFLTKKTNRNVIPLKHPIKQIEKTFSLQRHLSGEKTVITIGQWMRRYHSIYNLEAHGFQKMLSCGRGYKQDYIEMAQYVKIDSSVILTEHLQGDQYDEILSKSIVFLDLYDCAACNVLLECIIRNTPILINTLPATVEYLGDGYPLFYSSLDEATRKINSPYLIEEAHRYLTNLDKKDLVPTTFLKNLCKSVATL
jgi:hypothetical protein